MNALEALDRARVAWERTSPQLVIDGWLDMLDGLDEPHLREPERLVEPARPPCDTTAGGLTAGAGPATSLGRELTRINPLAGSAPSQHNGRCRISPEELRGSGQKGA